METVIGSLAALLTTLCFVPQLLKVVKDRDTKAISLTMYLVFACGVVLWLIYGILIGAMPVILANAITLMLVIVIIVMKCRLG